MTAVSLPYTLTAGQPENVNQLMANLDALVAGINTLAATPVGTRAAWSVAAENTSTVTGFGSDSWTGSVTSYRGTLSGFTSSSRGWLFFDWQAEMKCDQVSSSRAEAYLELRKGSNDYFRPIPQMSVSADNSNYYVRNPVQDYSTSFPGVAFVDSSTYRLVGASGVIPVVAAIWSEGLSGVTLPGSPSGNAKLQLNLRSSVSGGTAYIKNFTANAIFISA